MLITVNYFDVTLCNASGVASLLRARTVIAQEVILLWRTTVQNSGPYYILKRKGI